MGVTYVLMEHFLDEQEITIGFNLREFSLRSLFFFIQFTAEAYVVTAIICEHHRTAIMSL